MSKIKVLVLLESSEVREAMYQNLNFDDFSLRSCSLESLDETLGKYRPNLIVVECGLVYDSFGEVLRILVNSPKNKVGFKLVLFREKQNDELDNLTDKFVETVCNHKLVNDVVELNKTFIHLFEEKVTFKKYETTGDFSITLKAQAKSVNEYGCKVNFPKGTKDFQTIRLRGSFVKYFHLENCKFKADPFFNKDTSDDEICFLFDGISSKSQEKIRRLRTKIDES